MNTIENFKIGDTVYLKSEDKIDASKRNYMTITGFHKYDDLRIIPVVGVWKEGESGINCAWFKDNELQTKIFNRNLLTKADK